MQQVGSDELCRLSNALAVGGGFAVLLWVSYGIIALSEEQQQEFYHLELGIRL